MTRILVGGGHGDVVFGAVEDAAGELPVKTERVAVLHTPAVASVAERVASAIAATGRPAATVLVPDGEAAKDVSVAVDAWAALADAGITRSDAVVAVGGGALCDLAGFVAATWLRGVSVVHVPTTVLAMVDAAVGGKTAIDVSAGKNLVGAFHLPSAVVIDPHTLATLPDADFRAGLAEVVKAGFIADPAILDLVEQWTPEILARSPDLLLQLIELAVLVKVDVVSADPREAGRREILNYGHTLAHAIEHDAGYGAWRHGDAVSVGLCFAASLSRQLGRLDDAIAARHESVLSALGLPVRYEAGAWPRLLESMRHDKKARGATLRFVVLDALAHPVVVEDPDPALLAAAYEEVSA